MSNESFTTENPMFCSIEYMNAKFREESSYLYIRAGGIAIKIDVPDGHYCDELYPQISFGNGWVNFEPGKHYTMQVEDDRNIHPPSEKAELARVTEMTGVSEYAEEMPVELVVSETERGSRVVVRAYNEAGYNLTDVDLRDLLGWLRSNRPDLL